MKNKKNIGLVDVDGHNFPNLALMKISSYHKSMGDSVEFANMFGKYDILYKSKIFSWTEDPNYIYNTNKYIVGGTGFDYSIQLPGDVEHVCPDYSLYDCQNAYGFLTRGCIRRCKECIVPEKEGDIKAYADIDDFIGQHKTAVLMDNNVLASEHGIRQIEKIIKKGIKVDFNQGLDARLINNSIAKLLSKVKWLKPLRLACDSSEMIKHCQQAVKLLRWNNCTPSRYSVYALIKDIDESIDRIKTLKGLYLNVFAQVFRDKENKFIPTKKHYDLERFVNRKEIFNKTTFEEYK